MNDPKQAGLILLAEDEETDVILFRFAMKAAGLVYALAVVRDGQEAIDYLAGDPPYSNRQTDPLPSLVILDLKMPRMTGFDVLSWLANQAHLQSIPAVVLSSSSYPEDIQKAAQLGARDFYIKPHTVSELAKVLQSATGRWLGSDVIRSAG